jgi:hypothetical protein
MFFPHRLPNVVNNMAHRLGASPEYVAKLEHNAQLHKNAGFAAEEAFPVLVMGIVVFLMLVSVAVSSIVRRLLHTHQQLDNFSFSSFSVFLKNEK